MKIAVLKNWNFISFIYYPKYSGVSDVEWKKLISALLIHEHEHPDTNVKT